MKILNYIFNTIAENPGTGLLLLALFCLFLIARMEIKKAPTMPDDYDDHLFR